MSVEKFDKSAFTYDCKPMHVERAKAVANAIKECISIDKDWIIADFGCGTGLLGFQFAEDVMKIDMMDVSDSMLEVLRQKLKGTNIKGMRPVKLNIFTDKLPANKYDMIMTLMTFHHIEDIKNAVARLGGMLKEGGFLCVADLNEEDGSYHADGDTVHNGINQDLLEHIAGKNGLLLIKKMIPYVIRKKVDNVDRNYPVFLHIYKKESSYE